MKKKRAGEILPCIVLAGILGLLVILNIFCLDHWLDSDMAAEMIFSKLLSEENRIIATPDWYYSTEFRVLYTQLIMAPLFRICKSFHVIRAVTNVVFYLLLFGSFAYMMYPLKLKRKWVLWSGSILLLPFSETVMTHMHMGNTYMSHVILIFFTFGLFLRLVNSKKGQKVWYRLLLLGLYAGMCLICGMSGVRYLLALQCPLVLTAVWMILCGEEFRKLRVAVSMDNCRKVFTCSDAKYLWYSLLGLFAAVAGYGINVKIIASNYSFQTYESIQFIAVYKGIFLERLQNTLGSLLQLFGYISDKGVLSLRGVVTVIAFVLIFMCVYFVCANRKFRKASATETTDETGRMKYFMYRFFLAAFALNTFVFVFTNSTIVDRYYITVMIFILPLIAIYFEEEKMPLDRLLAGLLLVGCLFVSTVKEVYSIATVDKNVEKKEVAVFLEENGYTFGYATYNNANIITELTDGAVEVANILDPVSMEYFKWSSPQKYYTEAYEDTAAFLLLTEEEAMDYEAGGDVFGMEKVYEKDGYVVYAYR